MPEAGSFQIKCKSEYSQNESLIYLGNCSDATLEVDNSTKMSFSHQPKQWELQAI
jgi:hypothetical protein